MFGRYKIKLSDHITLHVINIESYSPRLKDYIERNIHQIWNGDNEVIESSNDIKITKTELKNLLDKKTDLQKNGIIPDSADLQSVPTMKKKRNNYIKKM